MSQIILNKNCNDEQRCSREDETGAKTSLPITGTAVGPLIRSPAGPALTRLPCFSRVLFIYFSKPVFFFNISLTTSHPPRTGARRVESMNFSVPAIYSQITFTIPEPTFAVTSCRDLISTNPKKIDCIIEVKKSHNNNVPVEALILF